MNMTSPILNGAAHAAALPGDSVTSLLKMVADITGLFADDSSDGVLGMLMSGLAGIATALAVTIALGVYFRSRYRSVRDLVRHSLAAALVLASQPSWPTTCGMRRWPISASIRPSPPSNSKSGCRRRRYWPSPIPRSNCIPTGTRGSPRCKARCLPKTTTSACSGVRCRWTIGPADRVVILNLPGRASCEFKLRLPASPSPSDQFGPWHLADRVASPINGRRNPQPAA